ncbi:MULTISPECIES: proton extrusion protein PcxA [unclassified Nostoc]|uniref:proton extrusion protein PcxA n=1 Tax=unclassified Nostoc TaxID=2593658 RepID=UPI002AD49B12|nr:proton extrusion protein PcxA [Nostoc sp. DedQUE03]MDZ7974368.1 proton extrusion protein PcxA [Nostoc sp. DedQUE03]MDZ8047754.1 proton extrusion protein PcxA [Nostoc sp. DedQUE02]
MKDSFSRKAESLQHKLKKYLRSLNRWLLDTPERALLEAYQAAQRIQNIENEHFDGKKISLQSVKYTENVMSYWQVYLNKNLTIIKIRLAEFQLSRGIVDISNSVLLEKLKFIDEVLEKYAIKDELISNSPLVPTYQPLKINQSEVKKQPNLSNINSSNINEIKSKPPNKTSRVVPSSVGRGINKIQLGLLPQTEEEFVRNYRISKGKTTIALRFLIILIIVPLLSQYLSKQFLVTPILERIRGDNTTQIFINSDMEKEALHELHNYQEELRFEYLLNQAPQLSSEPIQEKIKSKAIEISEEFRRKSNSNISNVFADLISLFSFGIVIALSKREILILKSFMDTIVYGLSDSAKAFLIILFTDIFVGFHSPDGWEVLLASLAEHLGLPASRNVIFFFIATFPVILNTIFKYWIFRYLSRLSPSALATLKEMDE